MQQTIPFLWTEDDKDNERISIADYNDNNYIRKGLYGLVYLSTSSAGTSRNDMRDCQNLPLCILLYVYQVDLFDNNNNNNDDDDDDDGDDDDDDDDDDDEDEDEDDEDDEDYYYYYQLFRDLFYAFVFIVE